MRKSTLVIILLPAVLLTSCSKFLERGPRSRSLSVTVDGATTETATPDSKAPDPVTSPDPLGTVAIRNVTQVRASMSAVTKISPSDAQISNYFNTVKSRLSLDGNVETVSPSMLLATTGLAGLYCQKLIAADRALSAMSTRTVFQNVDFTKDQRSLTPEVRTALFQKYAEVFWRREATEEELAVLATALDEALSGRPNSINEMVNAILITCTAALSSLDFIKS